MTIFTFTIQNFKKMEKENQLSHAFCEKYRKELKAYGLQQAVRDLISSCNKAEMKKLYLAREAEKKQSFKAELIAACNSIINADRKLMPAVRNLQNEIITA